MPLLRNNELYCDHIGVNENDRQDIMNFSVRDRRGEAYAAFAIPLPFLADCNCQG